MLLSGYTVTQIREGTELIDVVARAKADNRLDTAQMGQITIRASNGKNIPLDQVAELRPVLEEGEFGYVIAYQLSVFVLM